MRGGTKFASPTILASHPSEKAAFFARPASSDKMWDNQIMNLRKIMYNKKSSSLNVYAHGDVADHVKKMAISEKIISIPNAIYYRRIHSDSITERKDNLHQLDAVKVYASIKKDIQAWGDWPCYKNLFLRYKLNHLTWLYEHVSIPLKKPLIDDVLADMDREERWFFRNEKFPRDKRTFIDEVLGLTAVHIDGGNIFPDPIPFDSRISEPSFSPTPSADPAAFFENDLLFVHGWTVGKGRLGVNELGYGNPLSPPKNIKLLEHTILGAHCPSEVKVSFKRPVIVVGFMNGTSPWLGNSSCLFEVSGESLGNLYGPNDPTPELRLAPGTYILKTSSVDPEWMHSAWAIREDRSKR